MKILFVGSSYLYRGTGGDYAERLENSPYGMFEDMAQAGGKSVDLDNSFVGGGALESQWFGLKNADAREKIASENYDVVLFQETFGNREEDRDDSTGHNAENFDLYADRFAQLATQNGAQSVFFSPWTPDYLRTANSDPFRVPLDAQFRAAAQRNDAYYAPGNQANHDAFQALIQQYGGADAAHDLLTDGAIHANLHGAYLAAAVIYSTIYDEAPPANWRPAGLSAADAATMRQIAWNEVRQTGIVIGDGDTPPPPPPPNDDPFEGGDEDDRINGDNGANEIVGNGGADILNGRGGNDTMRGGTGADTLNGESGNDRLFGDSSVDTLNGGSGSDELNGGTGADTLNGDDGNDRLFGNTGEDRLFGDGGDDELSGGSGADYLNGGAGADLLLGKDGFDELRGGAGNDELRGGTGADRLYGGDNNDELHGGTSVDQLFGENGNDVLYGNQGDDQLNGGAGRDELFGGSALDTLRGGSDDDVLWGNEGRDRLFGDGGNDQLNGGTGNDRLDGGSGNDILRAASGNDTLLGGTGVDRMEGGLGDDVMTGGAQTDTFVFDLDFGADTITDFEEGIDLLRIDNDNFSGNLSRDAFVDAFGSNSGGNYVLDLGDGNSITFIGGVDEDVLADSLVLF